MINCIFCKIIAGEIPAFKVYEDEAVVAFLDINPVHKGHTLLIPKTHYAVMVDTPDDQIARLFLCAKKLMPAIRKATDADFVVLSVVGIDVPHFHIHLIPRFGNDGLTGWPTQAYADGEAKTIAQKITEAL